MSSIRLQTSTQTLTADEPRAFLVGREAGCDLGSLDPTVSRRHAEIRAVGDGWEVVDLGSSHGTWLNGQRVQRAILTGTSGLRFGQPSAGLDVTVTISESTRATPPHQTPPAFQPPPPPPAPPAAAPAPYPPAPERPQAAFSPTPPPGLDVTIVPQGPIPGLGGPGLLVRTRAGDERFGTRAAVRIGRDPGLEVVADDPIVSRQHALVEPRPDGWHLVDRSTSGTYLDGEPISTLHLEEPTTVVLGHPTAGYEVELVPILSAAAATAAITSRKRRRTLSVVGAAVVALVLIGGGITTAFVLGGDGAGSEKEVAGGAGSPSPDSSSPGVDDGRLSDEELDRAKQASVFIVAEDASGQPIYTGSGSIISDDGLILTNAHVGKPSAPGQSLGEDDPATLLISLTSADDDSPVKAAFQAEPIVADGVLDLAILKITADAEGNPIDDTEVDLPDPMPIGSSADLRTGDEITALGFPAIASLDLDNPLERGLTVTRGVVSTFKADSVIGDPRSEIDSDIRIGSGNSGGASINDTGELVGINSAVITAAQTPNDEGGSFTGGSALIRPVDLAQDIITIAEDGGQRDYVSPFLDQLPNSADDPTQDATFEATGWAKEGDGDCDGVSTFDDIQTLSGVSAGDTIYAYYKVRGLADGTPFGVRRVSRDGTEIDTLKDRWNLGKEAICVWIPFDVPKDVQAVNSQLLVGESGDPVADNPVLLK